VDAERVALGIGAPPRGTFLAAVGGEKRAAQSLDALDGRLGVGDVEHQTAALKVRSGRRDGERERVPVGQIIFDEAIGIVVARLQIENAFVKLACAFEILDEVHDEVDSGRRYSVVHDLSFFTVAFEMRYGRPHLREQILDACSVDEKRTALRRKEIGTGHAVE
jgi:hypothetical protein